MPVVGDNEYHLALKSAAGSLGMNVINARGQRDETALSRNPVQPTNIKSVSGESQYDQSEAPYMSRAYDNWIKGRGLDNADEDRIRFMDSQRILTHLPNRLILGPQEHFSTGHRDLLQNMSGPTSFEGIYGTQAYIAVKITTVGGFDAAQIWAWLRRVGTPGTLKVELRAYNSGEPSGATVHTSATLTTANIDDYLDVLYVFDPANYTMAGTTDFWIVFYGSAGDHDLANHWEIGADADGGTGNISADDAVTSYSLAAFTPKYRVVDPPDDFVAHFHEYRGAVYFATQPDDDGAGLLYINEDRGAADDNSGDLSKLEDATKSWTADEHIGKIVIVIAGPGSSEDPPWREITDNDSTSLTVSPNFKIAHTTTTEYVIVGGDAFTERSTTGLTKPVTSVLAIEDLVHYAQGDAVAIRRHREYNNSGTFTISDYADDGTNKAKFLLRRRDEAGGLKVIRLQNSDANSDVSFSEADAKAYGTNLTFGTVEKVGDPLSKITGGILYGEPANLWIFKEDLFYQVVNGRPKEVPLGEMQTIKSPKNGKASAVLNAYLFMSLLNGWDRYYLNNLDEEGPIANEGLPSDRQGPIVHAVSYPGHIFCAVDGGTDNYSSVLLYNEFGWHEYYRAPSPGLRIRRLHIQVVPGSAPDRLWVSMGSDVLWLPLPSDTLAPDKDANFTYTHQGMLETGWIYFNKKNIYKFFRSLSVEAENLSENNYEIWARFKTDDMDTWTVVRDRYDEVPSKEVLFSPDYDVAGRRIKLQFILETNDNTQSPKMLAYVIEGVMREDVKYIYTWNSKIEDFGTDIEGDETDRSAYWMLNKIDEWAKGSKFPVPLLLDTNYKAFGTNIRVFFNPTIVQPFKILVDEDEEGHLVQFNAIEA